MDWLQQESKADILVIDDTPENLNLLSAMLLEQGYKVRSVTKGSTGLRGAQAAAPDLILLDINMPVMNGYEVCQQLKADDRTREIPVIFISALEDVFDKVKAFAVGGVDYITKPFQVEEVLARIHHHLTIRRLQHQLQTQNAQLQQEIQDRKRAEEKFKTIFRLSPNPIALVTLADGQLLEANPSFFRMSGYPTSEAIGQTLAALKLIHPLNHLMAALQSLSTNGTLFNQEFELRTQPGEIKVILLSAEFIELGGCPCALLVANDITERKRLENEFISLVSHELRTPLTSLMGSLDLLSSGQLGELTAQGQTVLKIATTNTERLIRLVNDILDLERMKSGKITMQLSHCHLTDLIHQAVEAVQMIADRANISIVTRSMPLQFMADADRLLQTFINLLSNAIKFSESQTTIGLEATLHPTALAVDSPNLNTLPTPDEPHILITVKDQGRGIPADKLHLIFERFQQVDASDSRKKGGTGLGLAICRHIVEQHGGTIWVESVLGVGSTFYVLLPIH